MMSNGCTFPVSVTSYMDTTKRTARDNKMIGEYIPAGDLN
jgi:hypothetical protein